MDLYINLPPKDVTVAVAMSGGVDSSVVAAMLKEQGYNIIGLTLAMQGDLAPQTDEKAVRDAKKIAEFLDIPHHVVELSDLFYKEVITPFAESYLSGETPLPCVGCNRKIKFGALWEMAENLGADYLVTGHYMRWEPGHNAERPKIIRAEDKRKDQTFFLSQVPASALKYVRFPLGNMADKSQTRELAKKYGLEVHDKPDSQDICFVPEGKYAEIVEKLHPNATKPGDIIHIEDGRVLGQHKGIIYYTIGQRRGLEIGGGDPLYVLRLDAKENQIIVGPPSALHRKEVYVSDLNWLGDEEWPKEGQEVYAKTRSSQELKIARIYANKNDLSAKIIFDDILDSVAPGQICAMYDENERLLGGGWIVKAS